MTVSDLSCRNLVERLRNASIPFGSEPPLLTTVNQKVRLAHPVCHGTRDGSWRSHHHARTRETDAGLTRFRIADLASFHDELAGEAEFFSRRWSNLVPIRNEVCTCPRLTYLAVLLRLVVSISNTLLRLRHEQDRIDLHLASRINDSAPVRSATTGEAR